MTTVSTTMAAVLEQEPSSPQASPVAGAAIEFRHVSINFGEKSVLRDISFTLGHGETIIITGASESGKSVLLHLTKAEKTMANIPHALHYDTEGAQMLRVEDMPLKEMQALLTRVGFGHLACAWDNRPYVVPIHYAYDSHDLYFFTTEGMKTEYIAANSQVCLQVEEVHDPSHWRSVMVNGRAERVTEPEEMERAIQLIMERNPTLTPAVNMTQLDAWGRANIRTIYRIRPDIIDGRETV